MLGHRIHQGLRAGLLAAAATAGVLVGFGMARGAAAAPLNAIAHLAVGERAHFITASDPAVTVLGLVLLLGWLLLAGVLFALLFGWLRGAALWLAAFGFTAALALVDLALVPERFRPGFERALVPAEVVVVYLVLAAALALGARFFARAPA